jgi:rhodanese-related sulfurtransferase
MDGIMKVVRARYPSVRQLSTEELAAWLADNHRPPPLLLDVRQPAEFAVSHLPGAQRVDPNVAAAKLLPTLPAGRPVVVYCAAGWRSSALAARLKQAGFTAVQNLEGSIFKWANEDRPLERDGQTVNVVHPCSRASGIVLKKSVCAPLPGS